jgi:hypothetical protein
MTKAKHIKTSRIITRAGVGVSAIRFYERIKASSSSPNYTATCTVSCFKAVYYQTVCCNLRSVSVQTTICF